MKRGLEWFRHFLNALLRLVCARYNDAVSCTEYTEGMSLNAELNLFLRIVVVHTSNPPIRR